VSIGADLDPLQVQRVAMVQHARDITQLWVRFMRDGRLSACMFSMSVMLDDAGSIIVGHIDEQLREEGYAIVSHSHAIIGAQEAAGPNGARVQVLQCSLSILVRAVDGQAKRLVLA
jgi:hypothetical protein